MVWKSVVNSSEYFFNGVYLVEMMKRLCIYGLLGASAGT
jgi:hypothetical protein